MIVGLIGCQRAENKTTSMNADGRGNGTEKKRVLILCTGNSARSQMAEALWRQQAGDRWEAFSAGTSPKGFVHPLAIKVMKEKGIDISGQKSKSLEPYREQHFDLVITVCDNAAKNCPVFPNAKKMLHCPFDDPTHAPGDA